MVSIQIFYPYLHHSSPPVCPLLDSCLPPSLSPAHQKRTLLRPPRLTKIHCMAFWCHRAHGFFAIRFFEISFPRPAEGGGLAPLASERPAVRRCRALLCAVLLCVMFRVCLGCKIVRGSISMCLCFCPRWTPGRNPKQNHRRTTENQRKTMKTKTKKNHEKPKKNKIKP